MSSIQGIEPSPNERKIIVLTPVRDEDWVLGKFLWAYSHFADHILVLNQQSSDRSMEILGRFPKAVRVDYEENAYNESARSRILVDEARKRFGSGCVLLAFDADEIPIWSCLSSPMWSQLKLLEPGTVICFEKPEILTNPLRCVRDPYRFPCGLVDDGRVHHGKLIHGERVPFSQNGKRFMANELVIMHLARVRWIEFCVRQSYYCAIENSRATKRYWWRTIYYSPRFFRKFGAGVSEDIPNSWWEGYRESGRDLWSFHTARFNSFHLRVLRLFCEYGEPRFWRDDIWWEDWEPARIFFIEQGVSKIPGSAIRRPPALARYFWSGCANLLVFYWAVRKLFKPANARSMRAQFDL